MYPVNSVVPGPENKGSLPKDTDERNYLDSLDKVDDKKEDGKEKSDDKSSDKSSEEESEDEEDSESATGEDSEDDTESESDDDSEEEDTEDDSSDESEDEEKLETDSVYNQIKKSSPELFKKVPELKGIIFREQEYTKHFSTPKEAEEASKQVEILNNFREELFAGNSEGIIKALEQTGRKELEGFVGNLLPTIQKNNNDLYLRALYPEFKKMLRAVISSGDKDFIASAKNIHYFIFNDVDIDKEVGLRKAEKSPEEENLTKRERDFEERQARSFYSDLGNTTQSRIMRHITAPLTESGIPALLQKKISEEVYARVLETVKADVRHMGNITHMCKKAKEQGYTTDWKDRLLNASLSRAKVLIPKFRQEVLAEMKVSVEGGKEPKVKKRIPSSGKTVSESTKAIDPKKVDWSQTTERDFLDGKAVMKG